MSLLQTIHFSVCAFTLGQVRGWTRARVLRQKGPAFLNLFAAGGAAVGVSGTQASGYLSGNGLLTAMAFGRIAGQSAAKL